MPSMFIVDMRDPGVTVRPLKRGAKGTWIKGGLTWKAFQFPRAEFAPARRRRRGGERSAHHRPRHFSQWIVARDEHPGR